MVNLYNSRFSNCFFFNIATCILRSCWVRWKGERRVWTLGGSTSSPLQLLLLLPTIAVGSYTTYIFTCRQVPTRLYFNLFCFKKSEHWSRFCYPLVWACKYYAHTKIFFWRDTNGRNLFVYFKNISRIKIGSNLNAWIKSWTGNIFPLRSLKIAE